MDFSFFRKVIAFLFAVIMLLFIGFGFLYSNDTNDEFRENTMVFNDFWRVDGKIITFPYGDSEEFTLENTLPQVYGDQMLVLRVYYDYFEASVDGNTIIESRSNTLFGHETIVGKKEIWIPLDYTYTGSTISVKIDMQSSLYGSQITEAFITTRSAYAVMQMSQNIPSLVVFVVFTVTGILEVVIAAFYILRRANLIRRLTFEALFYAGCFSIIAAQWVLNETRLPFILFGYQTGFSVLTVVAFLLMPLMFLEISRALFIRISRVDNLIDGCIALIVVLACLFAVLGIIDWGDLVYLAHTLDIIIMIIVGVYSYKSIKEEGTLSSRTAIAIANGIFILLAMLSLAQYVNNHDTSYFITILIDLMIYIMVQVGLIYRRIGLNVREEQEFAQAKYYAYSDELTKLGNRHFFYDIVNDYEKHKLPRDLTYIQIDVNRLKHYNDTIGHEAGDELLRGTAECLKKAFETSSTATLARVGGDEFAILIVADEVEINRRLINLKNYLFKWHEKYVKGITVAVGYAAAREDESLSVEDLGRLADERMYVDKKNFYEKSGYDRRQ